MKSEGNLSSYKRKRANLELFSKKRIKKCTFQGVDGAEGIQRLKNLAVLAEDLDSVPKTHMVVLNHLKPQF